MQKSKYISKVFRGCLVLAVLLLCGCAKESDLVIETADGQADVQPVISESADANVTVSDAAQEQQESIFVQVTGAVKTPGVYELPMESRVFEAVQAAGGMTDDAAAESLNQALELTDRQMIVVYTQQEWSTMLEDADTAVTGAENAGQAADDGRVNINTASLDELCTISGIGRSRAESILTSREQHGAFASIEEIMNVSGIKDGLFQKIKDKIKV